MQKFKKGDKVVPVSKSEGVELEFSRSWIEAKEKKQGFLYINDYKKGIYIADSVESEDGDYFKEVDLIPYVEDISSKREALEEKIAEVNQELERLNGEYFYLVGLEIKELQKKQIEISKKIGGKK